MAATRLRVEMSKRLGMSEIEGLAVAFVGLHGELGQARLGELLDLSPGGTAALVQRLESEDRVVRRPDKDDRRMRLISLSPAMAAQLDRFQQLASAEVETVLAAVAVDPGSVLKLAEALAGAAEARADAAAGGQEPSPATGRLTPSIWG